ncbi:MAG: hypothetical protein AAF696_20230 [Bacteroidota bacterium]
MEKGAYVKLLDLERDYVDIQQALDVELLANIEFVDERGGSLVDRYLLEVSLEDMSPQNGNQNKEFAQLLVLEKESFQLQESGNWGSRFKACFERNT